MRHFSEQAWVDFERGFDTSAKAQEISAHIASGCLDCKASHGLWSRMQTMSLAEAAFAPPENLVRLVKLGFRPEETTQPDKWTAACLLFNSMSQPAVAGIRSHAATCGQVVYEADGLMMDLRFDRGPQYGTLSLVGQLLDKQVPRHPASGAFVILWTEEGQLVATTQANEFGEFCLEFRSLDRLQLTARIGTRKVRIPIANLK